ncbi:type II toxin-antitoxin system death-on-curing family toxin [Dactylosporangium sp. NPDC048998]|uniref:type II toxin-antitoxin system death-on-curing family toxin n=1 Tax=Dactylosporangium sp. NPDC048998 TaxID=3363976 RepID=UPI003714CE4A
MIVYLDLPSLLDLAELILDTPPPVRDMGLLASAAARPATVAFGVEAYEDIWTKAGALLQSIALNHALIDGNKRLAWVAARVFLDLNGVPPVVVDVDQAEAFVIQVVTHELDTVEEVAKALIALYADGANQ